MPATLTSPALESEHYFAYEPETADAASDDYVAALQALMPDGWIVTSDPANNDHGDCAKVTAQVGAHKIVARVATNVHGIGGVDTRVWASHRGLIGPDAYGLGIGDVKGCIRASLARIGPRDDDDDSLVRACAMLAESDYFDYGKPEDDDIEIILPRLRAIFPQFNWNAREHKAFSRAHSGHEQLGAYGEYDDPALPYKVAYLVSTSTAGTSLFDLAVIAKRDDQSARIEWCQGEPADLKDLADKALEKLLRDFPSLTESAGHYMEYGEFEGLDALLHIAQAQGYHYEEDERWHDPSNEVTNYNDVFFAHKWSRTAGVTTHVVTLSKKHDDEDGNWRVHETFLIDKHYHANHAIQTDDWRFVADMMVRARGRLGESEIFFDYDDPSSEDGIESAAVSDLQSVFPKGWVAELVSKSANADPLLPSNPMNAHGIVCYHPDRPNTKAIIFRQTGTPSGWGGVTPTQTPVWAVTVCIMHPEGGPWTSSFGKVDKLSDIPKGFARLYATLTVGNDDHATPEEAAAVYASLGLGVASGPRGRVITPIEDSYIDYGEGVSKEECSSPEFAAHLKETFPGWSLRSSDMGVKSSPDVMHELYKQIPDSEQCVFVVIVHQVDEDGKGYLRVDVNILSHAEGHEVANSIWFVNTNSHDSDVRAAVLRALNWNRGDSVDVPGPGSNWEGMFESLKEADQSDILFHYDAEELDWDDIETVMRTFGYDELPKGGMAGRTWGKAKGKCYLNVSVEAVTTRTVQQVVEKLVLQVTAHINGDHNSLYTVDHFDKSGGFKTYGAGMEDLVFIPTMKVMIAALKYGERTVSRHFNLGESNIMFDYEEAPEGIEEFEPIFARLGFERGTAEAKMSYDYNHPDGYEATLEYQPRANRYKDGSYENVPYEKWRMVFGPNRFGGLMVGYDANLEKVEKWLTQLVRGDYTAKHVPDPYVSIVPDGVRESHSFDYGEPLDQDDPDQIEEVMKELGWSVESADMGGYTCQKSCDYQGRARACQADIVLSNLRSRGKQRWYVYITLWTGPGFRKRLLQGHPTGTAAELKQLMTRVLQPAHIDTIPDTSTLAESLVDDHVFHYADGGIEAEIHARLIDALEKEDEDEFGDDHAFKQMLAKFAKTNGLRLYTVADLKEWADLPEGTHVDPPRGVMWFSMDYMPNEAAYEITSAGRMRDFVGDNKGRWRDRDDAVRAGHGVHWMKWMKDLLRNWEWNNIVGIGED